jgi:ATP-dependent Clp protease adaptor protein ClpS
MDINKQEMMPETEVKELNEILEGLGISPDGGYSLILWNDDVNSFIDVVVALYEVCRLSNEKCVSVMMKAHTTGKALVTTGDLDGMLDMKNGLSRRGLQATVERNTEE